MTAPHALTVQRIVSLAMETISQLREQDGLVLDTEDAILDALDEDGIAVDAILSRLIRAILDASANVEATDDRINDLRARRLRFQRHEEAYRGTLQAAMEALGLRKYQDPEATAYITEGRQKVTITDEFMLPPRMVEVTVTRTPDKAAISEALHRGETVPGAALSNRPSILSIRSK